MIDIIELFEETEAQKICKQVTKQQEIDFINTLPIINLKVLLSVSDVCIVIEDGKITDAYPERSNPWHTKV